MQTYLVGGAVRNQLMGLPAKDLDYVVVGSTEQEMLALGYQRVGAHFPVFLHPHSKQEYALARTEQSTGAAHTAFTCETANVTIEQDLYRRDFTINAIALADDGTYIDPYGGRADLAARTLRHISPHFAEDPLRVLRGARFAAQYGLDIAPETLALMREMVYADMLNTLPVERIKAEFDKAIMSDGFKRFCEVLGQIGGVVLLRMLNVCCLVPNLMPEFATSDSYKVRVLKVALSHKQVRCFTNKHLIGAQMFKLTEYVHSFSSQPLAPFYAHEIAKLVNQTLGNLLSVLPSELYADAVYCVGADNAQLVRLRVLADIYAQLKGVDFAGADVEQIKATKLAIVLENLAQFAVGVL